MPKGKDILIPCLNPEHEDTNPSLRIDRETGLFHCLSCGYKGNIYKYFNRDSNIIKTAIVKLNKTIEELRKASWSGLDMPQDAFFVSQDFRGIDKETIEKFQGFCTDELGMSNRLVFPIYDSSEKLVAFIGRYTHIQVPPKYLIYPKSQAMPWYPNPSRVRPINRSVVLVEGILDALFLHSKGITNAVCIFGTKSVSYDNVADHISNYYLTGVDKFYIMLDGDSAGRNAAKDIQRCIQHKTDVVVEIIDLADGKDPATLSDEEIEYLKEKFASD